MQFLIACLCYFFKLSIDESTEYGKRATAEWLRGMVIKLGTPVTTIRDMKALAITVQYRIITKMNCNALAKYLNIICIHREKRKRDH